MPGKKPTIQAAENGPFIVKGLERLANTDGDPVPMDLIIAGPDPVAVE